MLSEALGHLQVEENSLQELQVKKDELEKNLSQASTHSAKIFELQVFQEYLAYVDQQIQTKNNDVQKAQHQVTDKKDDLSDKMLEEKVWTKAKEKAYVQYKALSLKKEQEQLDEIATMRYISISP
jgi:flagellar FliJ protein